MINTNKKVLLLLFIGLICVRSYGQTLDVKEYVKKKFGEYVITRKAKAVKDLFEKVRQLPAKEREKRFRILEGLIIPIYSKKLSEPMSFALAFAINTNLTADKGITDERAGVYKNDLMAYALKVSALYMQKELRKRYPFIYPELPGEQSDFITHKNFLKIKSRLEGEIYSQICLSEYYTRLKDEFLDKDIKVYRSRVATLGYFFQKRYVDNLFFDNSFDTALKKFVKDTHLLYKEKKESPPNLDTIVDFINRGLLVLLHKGGEYHGVVGYYRPSDGNAQLILCDPKSSRYHISYKDENYEHLSKEYKNLLSWKPKNVKKYSEEYYDLFTRKNLINRLPVPEKCLVRLRLNYKFQQDRDFSGLFLMPFSEAKKYTAIYLYDWKYDHEYIRKYVDMLAEKYELEKYKKIYESDKEKYGLKRRAVK